MQFFAKFPLIYAIFSYFLFTIFDFCSFSSFFANFSHFFWKYPNFGLKFLGSFRISKTTHKMGFGKIRIFQKNIHPCHAPCPQIILKLKATIFIENISNSNGVDTTSNNFSDNILTNKRIKFNHMTPPCRERGTKHPRTTHHCLRGSHHPSSSDRESSFSWKHYLKESSREWVSSEPNWRLRILSVPSMSELIARKWVLYWFPLSVDVVLFNVSDLKIGRSELFKSILLTSRCKNGVMENRLDCLLCYHQDRVDGSWQPKWWLDR